MHIVYPGYSMYPGHPGYPATPGGTSVSGGVYAEPAWGFEGRHRGGMLRDALDTSGRQFYTCSQIG